jgi:histidinol-phosphatase (PHP family)
MKLASYHVHTRFCDGQDTAEEMVLAAIGAGMSGIGFSAHAAWPFATGFHLAFSRYTEYFDEIERLKALYGTKIGILRGFEADYLPPATMPDPAIYARFSPDFLIGSVHFVATDKKNTPADLWAVDAEAEEVQKGIRECFDGDGKRAAQAYWHTVRDMIATCRFDIIGHLDVLRKRNGVLHFFDESAAWYRDELENTAAVIARSGKIVELNTGAIARKAMDGIYPSDDLLSILRRYNIPIVINSDAHRAKDLLCAYDQAREAALRAGFTSISYRTYAGWQQELL